MKNLLKLWMLPALLLITGVLQCEESKETKVYNEELNRHEVTDKDGNLKKITYSFSKEDLKKMKKKNESGIKIRRIDPEKPNYRPIKLLPLPDDKPLNYKCHIRKNRKKTDNDEKPVFSGTAPAELKKKVRKKTNTQKDSKLDELEEQ